MTENEFYQHWQRHPNYEYTMQNRNGDTVMCRVVYFPIRESYDGTETYDPPRALVEVGSGDFRQVPYIYINL